MKAFSDESIEPKTFNKLVNSFDQNCKRTDFDEKLGYSDFIASTCEKTYYTQEVNLKAAFNFLNKNKSGNLTKSDLLDLFTNGEKVHDN